MAFFGAVVVIGALIVLQVDTQKYEDRLEEPEPEPDRTRGFEVIQRK